MLKSALLLTILAALTMAAAGVERRLYVTDSSGISVYDIDNGHKLLRKIELPGTGDYKGIAASPQLGKLYVTSFKGDVMICIDLLTDAVVWKKRSEEHTSELQSHLNLVCRLLLEKKKSKSTTFTVVS